MSKAKALRWVIDLSKDQADGETFLRHYDDVTTDLGKMLVSKTTQAVSVNDPAQAWPDEAISLIALFWDGQFIHNGQLSELESLNADWRDERGTPRCWVLEDETDKTFRLYPNPQVGGTLTILYAERRDEMPEWLDFLAGLEVLRREFSHFSDHRNPELAGSLGEFKKKVMEYLG